MIIAVTGGGGFIGSHLVESLLGEGHRVRALARYNGRGDISHLRRIADATPDRLDVILGDVRDARQVRQLIDGCDVVFHLAALIGIPYSYVAPESYVSTNVMGTFNVLEACRETNVGRLIITSTSEVYGTAQRTPMDENHPLQAQSPYAASKIAADKLGESYFRSFDLPVVTLRPFNTYGPRQSARAVIPTVLTQALRGGATIELGSLEPRRDLTFVADTVRAFVLAATAPGIEGETIHCGQGTSVSVGDLAKQCLDITGSRATVRSASKRKRPLRSEVELLLCDAAKAARLLSWKPEVTLEEGLARTAEYIRQNLADYAAEVYVQ